MEVLLFLSFIVDFFITMIFKVQPYYYMITFLSTYSPEEHLFVSKMVPLFWGCNLQVLLASFFSVALSIDVLALQSNFIIDGFTQQLPWNTNISFVDKIKEKSNSLALEYDDFKDFVLSGNVTGHYNGFMKTERLLNGTNIIIKAISIQQFYFGKHIIDHVDHNKSTEKQTLLCIVFMVIVGGIIGQFFFYSKLLWKVIYRLYWSLVAIYFGCLMYVISTYFEDDMPPIKRARTVNQALLDLDLPSLALSVTAPPILHVMFSRSTEPIDPDWDSAILVAFIFIFNIFRASTYNLVKNFVEADIGYGYFMPLSNIYSSFFYFSTFFNMTKLGHVINMIYFVVNYMAEYLIFIVTYQSLIEIIFYEWPINELKKWMISPVIAFLLLLFYFTTYFYTRMYLYVFSQILASLSEIVIIVCFYPYGRLLDDITFQSGTPTSKLKEYSLLLLPIYYSVKTYRTLSQLHIFLSFVVARNFNIKVIEISYQQMSAVLSNFHAYWGIMLVTVPIGMIYAIIKYVYVNKKEWSSLLRPKPTWGPRDHVTRQLRKQFQSRVYIPSQSSRYLARYMLEKAETDTYRLDVRYTSAAAERRRSRVIGADDFRFEDDKKMIS